MMFLKNIYKRLSHLAILELFFINTPKTCPTAQYVLKIEPPFQKLKATKALFFMETIEHPHTVKNVMYFCHHVGILSLQRPKIIPVHTKMNDKSIFHENIRNIIISRTLPRVEY